MRARETPATAESFVELLRQQIEILQDVEYDYGRLEIYTAGSDEPWTFDRDSELEIHEPQDLLVARDGPSEDQGNEEVPEYVIRLSSIVASQLI